MRATYTICRQCDGAGCATCHHVGSFRAPEIGDPSECAPLVLPDDPAAALRFLAQYISYARAEKSRAFREGGYVVGYWQTDDYTEGLLDLGLEALRVARLAGDTRFLTKTCESRAFALHAHSIQPVAPEGRCASCALFLPSVRVRADGVSRCAQCASDLDGPAIKTRESRACRLFPYLLAAFLVAACLALAFVFHLTIHQHLP